MALKSVPPLLSEIQKSILVNITKRRDSPQHLVKRVKIVLLTAEMISDKDVALQLQQHRNTIFTWRHRWIAQQENLKTIESKEDVKALEDYIANVVLADNPYNGVRGKYTPEQIAQLYAIACEQVQDSDRPISHWSCRELANEMVKRGIVEHIPKSTVWAFLKSGGIKTAQSTRLAKPQTGR
jgi:transposase